MSSPSKDNDVIGMADHHRDYDQLGLPKARTRTPEKKRDERPHYKVWPEFNTSRPRKIIDHAFTDSGKGFCFWCDHSEADHARAVRILANGSRVVEALTRPYQPKTKTA